MTLSFSQTWPSRMGELAGQPNYFTNKIMKSMWLNYPDETRKFVIGRTTKQARRFMEIQPFEDLTFVEEVLLPPKLHTIREDKSNCWKAGMKIHPVINNRTKNRFQFAPVIECVSVQSIEITKSELLEYGYASKIPLVYIDDVLLETADLEKLAINDGFPTLKAFFAYFNEDFTGKIIHWSDLKY